MKDEKPKVTVKFEQSPHFDEEFIEFIEEVLKWTKKKNEENGRKNQLTNQKFYGKRTLQTL